MLGKCRKLRWRIKIFGIRHVLVCRPWDPLIFLCRPKLNIGIASLVRNAILHLSWKFQVKILKNAKAAEFLVKSILRLLRIRILEILFIVGSFFPLVFTFQLILSYRLQRTCSLGLPFILNWSRSKICSAYAQLWAYGFWLITLPFFVRSICNFICEFRRPLATSY